MSCGEVRIRARNRTVKNTDMVVACTSAFRGGRNQNKHGGLSIRYSPLTPSKPLKTYRVAQIEPDGDRPLPTQLLSTIGATLSQEKWS